MSGWVKHKLESRLLENINNLRCADDTTLIAESKEELKSVFMNVKEKSEEDGLKNSMFKNLMFKDIKSFKLWDWSHNFVFIALM